jgi:hypothetical protein
MAAVQEYITRLQPQIASDSRFQEVRLLGYNGDDPSKPYIPTTGTVRSEQDWTSLDSFIHNSKPPIPISTRSVLVRRQNTNFTSYLHQVKAVTPDGGVVFGGGSARQPTTEMAYQHLLSVKLFAVGGAGYGMSPSSGDLALRVVLMSTNAMDLLLDVATKGSTEGKLYSLCGIRKLRLTEFDRLAAGLVRENATVSTASGCVFSRDFASYVVERIKAGSYDAYLRILPTNK